ncbi:hypothetical protein HY478_00675 [Candidatus Uhrbacteria bacterium]|nr:hypothetical protein [Candidatus Uhrbacteria bacterium]
MRRSSYWFLTLSICGVLSVPVGAIALTISPPLIELALEPGGEYSRTIRVYNEGTVSVRVHPEVLEVVGTESGEPSFVTPVDFDSTSVTEWIGRPATFELGAGEWVEVPFTIKVPPEAAPGTVAAAVLFTSIPLEEGGAVTVFGRTGPIVLVTVQGEIEAAGRIIEFVPVGPALGRGLYDAVPQSFLVRIENTGSIVLVPQGTITIANMFGAAVATMGVNNDGRRALPQWTRSFEETRAGELPENGFLREWRAFGLGRYHATVTVQIGEAAHQENITFWVVPWRTMSLAAAGLLTLVLAGRARRKLSL